MHMSACASVCTAHHCHTASPSGWPANTPSIVRLCCGIAEVLWCTFRVLTCIEARPDIDTGANSRGGGLGSAAHQQHAALAKQEICLDHSSLCRSKRRGWVVHPMLPGAPIFLIFGEGGHRGHIFRFLYDLAHQGSVFFVYFENRCFLDFLGAIAWHNPA